MTTYREKLIDRMIAIYAWNNKLLTILVRAYEAEPYFEED